jgi:DNA-binding MltR family transcriptional regulator
MKRLSKTQIPINAKWLLKESDAGCMMVGSSVCDQLLKGIHTRVIRANTIETTGSETSNTFLNELTGFNKPLGTFSARIKLAYAYKLISEHDYKCLEAIRTIRNEPAHADYQFHFDDENISPIVESLLEHSAVNNWFDLVSDYWKPMPSREKSIVISAFLAMHELLADLQVDLNDRILAAKNKINLPR